MLSHVQVPLKVALGEVKPRRTFIGFLFGGMAKKKSFSEKPFPQNLPTDASFIRKGGHDFDMEKNGLVNRFVAAGTSGLSKEPHPFFGKLTEKEWSTSLWKHIDHQLRQFSFL